ncbi:hypothetical protein [Sorangium sp. So ce117]|uniref:hypothetical protein n=1 Tax=Sorangium sp. So ce117 TaxID=3133277 RepID=UPI003F5EF1E0
MSLGDLVDEVPEDPLLTGAVQRALVAYAAVLPEDVLRDVEMLATRTLFVHPLGISFVARLAPGIRVEVDMGDDLAEQAQQGFAVGEIMISMMRVLRRRSRERGERRFLMPETPMLMLQAFLGYFNPDPALWTMGDDAVRGALDRLCEAVVGLFFTGLVVDVLESPSSLDDWGETGLALSAGLPAMTAALRGARARLSRRDRHALETYDACGWDPARLERRLGGGPEPARPAFFALGAALAAELRASPAS